MPCPCCPGYLFASLSVAGQISANLVDLLFHPSPTGVTRVGEGLSQDKVPRILSYCICAGFSVATRNEGIWAYR